MAVGTGARMRTIRMLVPVAAAVIAAGALVALVITAALAAVVAAAVTAAVAVVKVIATATVTVFTAMPVALAQPEEATESLFLRGCLPSGGDRQRFCIKACGCNGASAEPSFSRGEPLSTWPTLSEGTVTVVEYQIATGTALLTLSSWDADDKAPKLRHL